MKQSFLISTYIQSKPNLTKEEIEKTSVFLAKQNGSNPEKIIPGVVPQIAFEEDFQSLGKPDRIIKMSKTEYIDDFFKTGKIMLGSFNYYKGFDNPEIGDKTEGSTIVVGKSKVATVFAEIGGGYNNHLFCCYEGEPDPEVINKFGYDDHFEIVDLEGFSQAIQKTLQAKQRFHSKCLYREHKILVGHTPNNYNYGRISIELENLVNQSKYFIKTSNFQHQNEYRFLWTLEEDITDFRIIECPEAVKYCKR